MDADGVARHASAYPDAEVCVRVIFALYYHYLTCGTEWREDIDPVIQTDWMLGTMDAPQLALVPEHALDEPFVLLRAHISDTAQWKHGESVDVEIIDVPQKYERPPDCEWKPVNPGHASSTSRDAYGLSSDGCPP
jgi:hypothetical protein